MELVYYYDDFGPLNVRVLFVCVSALTRVVRLGRREKRRELINERECPIANRFSIGPPPRFLDGSSKIYRFVEMKHGSEGCRYEGRGKVVVIKLGGMQKRSTV